MCYSMNKNKVYKLRKKYISNLKYIMKNDISKQILELIEKEEIEISIITYKELQKNKSQQQENKKQFANNLTIILPENSKYKDILLRINNKKLSDILNLKGISKNTNILNENKLIKNFIKKELEQINFNMLYKGTKYLVEVIYESYIHKNLEIENLTKTIYPIIAKKYNKTVDAIYADIKYSINIMYNECDEKILNNFLNYNCIIKPKPREIISTVLNNIIVKYDV